MTIPSTIAVAGGLSVAWCASMSMAAAIDFDAVAARAEFRQSHPKVLFMERDSRLHKIAAPAIAAGTTAKASAEAAKAKVAPMLGVDAQDFIEVGPFPDGRHSLNLMYRPETDDYKFTGYYWTQTAGNLPVWRTRLMALVRNDAGFPVVQVTSDVRDVSGYVAPARLNIDDSLAEKAATRRLGRDAWIADKIDLFVFAGVDDMVFTPRPSLIFEAGVGSVNDPNTYQKLLLVVDAETGVLLHEENRILHATSGTVEGNNTQSSGADECDPEAMVPMPYALVTGGGQSAYADAKGYFELNTSGSVTINSNITGLYFYVNETSGNDSTSVSANDGDYVSIQHHQANNNEQYRAQINAYVESNEVRDFTLQYAPDFPVVNNQTGFPCNTGVSGTCNAFYDYSSINFYNAGGGCNNTSFSVVVHHEYGHHLVASAGSGQDQYGEGMGDVMSVLITGDAQLARGFYQGDCANGIRNADNTMQYPCSGGIHECGQLISGCVWDALETVEAANPGQGLDIVASLAINSMPLHSGGSIDPTITFDWLTLDDDDGDLDNGTPHSEEILAAFALHNMDDLPEPLDNDDCETAREITWGTWDVNTIGALSSGTPVDESQCSGTYMTECDPDVWYHLVACGTGTMTVSLCDLATFDTDLAVYSGSCGDLTQVACNGDGAGCGGYTSYLEMSVVEGESLYIRVGGWEGSTGVGQIYIDGPGDPCDTEPSVTIGYPEGRPDYIDPNGGTTVAVSVEAGTGTPVSGTEYLYYREDAGSWSSVAMAGDGVSYTATFPEVTCGAVIDWYVGLDTTDGLTVTSPSNAPSGYWSADAWESVIISFEDDFETDTGWSVDAGATEGNWQRATPANGGVRCDNPTDYDGSGMCYVTGNGSNEDVDGGTTVLTSPLLDASEGGTLTYARWYNNGSSCNGADPLNDVFVVDYSIDGGATWTNLETVGPTGGEVSGGWFEISHDLATVPGFDPTEQFRLRFVCGDLNDGSVIEAAVDAISISKADCGEGPACDGDFDGSGAIDTDDLLFLIGAWGGPDGDVDGDGTTGTDDLLFLISGWGPCK